MWGDHVLLMTAKGATSGEAITTPLVYGREGDDYIIVASKGGAPMHPTWFGNIKANPEVEVEVAEAHGTAKFEARARVVESRPERDRLLPRNVKNLALISRLPDAHEAPDSRGCPRTQALIRRLPYVLLTEETIRGIRCPSAWARFPVCKCSPKPHPRSEHRRPRLRPANPAHPDRSSQR